MARDNTNPRMREKQCKMCGRVGHWHTFCSDSCKQKHYRQRKKEKLAGEIKALDSWMREDLQEDDYRQVCSLLNRIPTDKYAKLINDAMIIVVQSYHAQVRKAKTGRK